jgi:BirA family biotin operon repressor/biotin-[acetyl-CoA-carboxylase] ligase
VVVCSDRALPGYGFVSLYDEVSSTMDVARERLGEVAVGRAGLVVATSQLAGRGRQGRSWVSNTGAFMGTFLFAAPGPVSLLSGYSLAVGVGVARALEELGADVSLKWPNDIVVGCAGSVRKLGGVLIEVQEGTAGRVLLVGLGLNISSSPEGVPHATSLASLLSEAGQIPDRDFILNLLAAKLLVAHQEFLQNGGFRGFRKQWEARSAFSAGVTPLTVELAPGSVVSGTYAGVDETGALRLQLQDGSERSIHSGHLML